MNKFSLQGNKTSKHSSELNESLELVKMTNISRTLLIVETAINVLYDPHFIDFKHVSVKRFKASYI